MKKADTSQLKGLIQKLGVIRNYSSFILPTVLMVVALFLLLVLAPLMSKRLKERMNKVSVSSGKQVKSLSSEKIVREQWKVERDYQDAYEKDANDMAMLTKQTSQRELLSYVIFQEPNETSTIIFDNFGRRYRSELKELIADLEGRQRPTDIELLNSIQKSSSANPEMGPDGRYSRSLDRGRTGQFSYDKTNEVERTIVNELCLDVAELASFYANAADLPGYEFWDTSSSTTGLTSTRLTNTGSTDTRYNYQSMEQSVGVCWYWQIGYWIIEDVLKTFSAINSDCENVLDCPAKRLVSVDFGEVTESRSLDKAASAMPSYVKSSQEGWVRSFTQRVSNEKIDVVHFRIEVVVSAKDALSFMQELCSAKEHTFKGFSGNEPEQKFKHNQITILDSSIEPVEVDSPEHELYRYGDDAVVKLDLTCEYIFDVAGYDQVKPKFLKDSAEMKDEYPY